MTFPFTPIGTIRTPYQDIAGMPIQSAGALDTAGRAVLKDRYTEGLKDLEGFSHLILIYVFHDSREYDLSVKPFLGDQKRGLFATRAPRRPNPIGISVVRLVRIEGPVVHFLGADVLDGTPLLDIKPYVPKFDAYPEATEGWLAESLHRLAETKSDERFRS